MKSLENNKVIAVFMEYGEGTDFMYLSHPDTGFDTELDELKYNTSWDWLMPVVDKIENLGYTTSFKTKYVRINPKENYSYYNYISFVTFNEEGWTSNRPYASYDDDPDMGSLDSGKNKLSKLEAVHKAVVQFIKWYNKQ